MTFYQFECKVKALSKPDSRVYLKIKTNRGIVEYYPFFPSIKILNEKELIWYPHVVPKSSNFLCIDVYWINDNFLTKDKALCMIEKCKKHYKRYYKDLDNMPIYLNVPFTAFNDFVCEGLYEMVYDIEYNNDTLEYAFEQSCKNRNKKHHNRK